MKIFLLTFALGFAVAAFADSHDHAQHAFVLVGDGETHLYHLARFDSPHRYQALVAVTLTRKGGQALDVGQLRRSLPDGTVLSVVSRTHWPMTDLAARPAEPYVFQGDVYAGYMRDAAHRKLLLEDLTVTRTAVRHFSTITRTDTRSDRAKLILVCDRTTGYFTGAHRIQGGPSFEQVIGFAKLWRNPATASGDQAIPCTDALQGIEAVVLGEPDQPLSGRWALDAYVPALDAFVSLGRMTPVFTDEKAVNATP